MTTPHPYRKYLSRYYYSAGNSPLVIPVGTAYGPTTLERMLNQALNKLQELVDNYYQRFGRRASGTSAKIIGTNMAHYLGGVTGHLQWYTDSCVMSQWQAAAYKALLDQAMIIDARRHAKRVLSRANHKPGTWVKSWYDNQYHPADWVAPSLAGRPSLWPRDYYTLPLDSFPLSPLLQYTPPLSSALHPWTYRPEPAFGPIKKIEPEPTLFEKYEQERALKNLTDTITKWLSQPETIENLTNTTIPESIPVTTQQPIPVPEPPKVVHQPVTVVPEQPTTVPEPPASTLYPTVPFRMTRQGIDDITKMLKAKKIILEPHWIGGANPFIDYIDISATD